MKHKLKILWYYIETRYANLLILLGFKRDTSVIPKGQYCSVLDEERNMKEPCTNGSHYIKTCKYYRGTSKTGGIACIYTGFFGFDVCLYDQCKICGKITR
jgi:hypothetical protein